MVESIWGHLGDALAEAGVAVDALTPELSLDEDLGLDSFQLMKLARHLEKAYDFRFSLADWVLAEEQKDVHAFRLGSLVAFVEAHTA